LRLFAVKYATQLPAKSSLDLSPTRAAALTQVRFHNLAPTPAPPAGLIGTGDQYHGERIRHYKANQYGAKCRQQFCACLLAERRNLGLEPRLDIAP
jgi:hypothetical protein